ncbi:MAG: GNAT family N-acetyltransferase [Acidobacteria bacterium]|nr:GNAT family N-acetyltransferase [Acidobacteriota bacterium]
MSTEIERRAITDDDLPFLSRLYASTREEELAPLPWSDEQKRVFLEQQFNAQHVFYQQQFPDAVFDVLLVGGEPAGRLYLVRWTREIRIVDIALLPEFRGRGLGGGLLEGILDEGRREGKKVSIHVERNNPAMHLYRRLGFVDVEDKGVYLLMEWQPEA